MMQYHMFRDDKGALIPVSAEVAAEHLDLSVTRFNDLVRRGVLPREGRAKFDIDAIRLAYIRHIRDVAGGRKSDSDAPELTAERARLTRAQASKAEMELAALEGILVPAEDVEKVWGSLTSSFRSRMISLPGKFAHQCAAMTNAAEVEALLRESIYEALNEISQTKPEQSDLDENSRKDSEEIEAAATSEGESVGR